MSQDMAVADAIYQHVLGANDPSGSLIDVGMFPLGWVEEYCRLLSLAQSEWAGKPLWPRRLVGALYYVVTHMDLRYKVWCMSQDNRRSNKETDYQLATVMAPTRIFLGQAFRDLGHNSV